MRILITGDYFVSDQFNSENLIDDSIQELFDQADYRIVNLEAPITENNSKNKIIKTGPHLRMSEDLLIPNLKNLNIDCVTLANNHILDYGADGLLDTFRILEKNNISHVGAGKNLNEAAKHHLIVQEGLKIAILNFCENEWSIAEDDSPGSNPIDIIDNSRQIKKAKKEADRVLVIIHGGHEYYNLPSPRMQKQYRFYADQGADMVIGHHTHCISGDEVYNGVPIYYSLGNFLFTKSNKNDEWYNGLVLEANITKESVLCKLHPVKQQRETFNLLVLDGDDKVTVLDRVESFSKIITDKTALNIKWEELTSRQSSMYLNYWSLISFVKNRYLNAALRKSIGNIVNKKGLSLYLNLLRCEAHRDLSEKVLEKYLKE